jgi:hypothetical protein
MNDLHADVIVSGKWRVLVAERDNYQRLRLTIHATHGDPSAGLYELRCYADTSGLT